MSNNASAEKQPKQYFFLNELLGARVALKGKRIGKFADVAIRDGDVAAEVTHIYVSRSFGNPSLLIPWKNVTSMGRKETVIDIENVKKYEKEPESGTVLLRDHILDKKVLDMEGREVEVVYDVKMVILHGKLYISDVDTSRYGLIRRMGLKPIADLIHKLADGIQTQTIPWSYVEPLPTDISTFKGDLKLKVLKAKLSELHPVDLADILEEVDPEQRTILFGELDTSHASDALEEIDPSVQRIILASLSKERIAQLVDEMTPGQAADVLAVLSSSDVRDILELMNNENSKKIGDILEKHETRILDFATSNYLRFPPDMTVKEAHAQYRRVAAISDEIMYLYIVDDQDKLLGVIDIRELLKANDDARLGDVMTSIVASLNQKSTLREASAMFNRYGFRALPIVDETDKILGVVPYRDMINLKHRFLE